MPNNNLSFDVHTLELFRQIKRKIEIEKNLADDIRRYMREHNQRRGFQINNIISSVQAEQLMTLVAESNALLAKEYLDEEDGVLFREAGRAGSEFNPADVQQSEVTEFLQKIDPVLSDRYQQKIA